MRRLSIYQQTYPVDCKPPECRAGKVNRIPRRHPFWQGRREADGGLTGAGVNIAARLEGIAKPRGRAARSVCDRFGTQRELPVCINSLAAPRRGLKPDGDHSAAAPAATRSHALRGRLRPPAAEWLSADGGPPTAKRLCADANERPEGSSAAERLSRADTAERWGRSQAVKGRSQGVRRNPTHQFSLNQHSLLGVAIGRLSIRRPALCRINALERWLDGSEAGAAKRPSADGDWPPTAKRL